VFTEILVNKWAGGTDEPQQNGKKIVPVLLAREALEVWSLTWEAFGAEDLPIYLITIT